MKDAYSFDVSARGRPALLQQDVRLLFAHLRAHGPQGRSDAGRDRAHRRHGQPRVSDPRRTGESAVFFDRDFYDMDWTCFDIDYDDVGSRRCRSSTTSPANMRRPTTSTIRPSSRARAGRAPPVRPRHRGRAHLLLRHQIFGAAWVRWCRTGRQAGRGASRAPTASACRASSAPSSRRAMTKPASSGRSRSRRSRSGSSISSRAMPRRDAACEKIYLTARRRGVEVLYDDTDERAGRQVRGDGPDRPAVAGHRRPARAEGRELRR